MIRTLLAAALVVTSTVAFADSHTSGTKAMIETKLAQHGIEYDVETLTDQQIGAIENILSDSSSSANNQKAAIMALLGLN